MWRSLRLRLLASAAVWVVVALALAGVGLQALFESYVERQMVGRLALALDHMAANLEITADGDPILRSLVPEPLFQRPLSGMYWQIESPQGIEMRSRSLWDEVIRVQDPSTRDDGLIHIHRAIGPGNQRLLVVERVITIPEAPYPFRLLVGRDESGLRRLFGGFTQTIAFSLGLLALGIMLAVWGQVTFGLTPFRRLRVALAQIRGGDRATLDGRYPVEVQPLVDDLNALLVHNSQMIDTARTQAGNLAHALKTPLAIIANEAEALEERGDPEGALLLRQQVDAMRRHVDHHLARARAQAASEVRTLSTPVVPSIERLLRVMQRLHDHHFDLDLDDSPPAFRGQQDTLEEILGNLVDNACKWARHTVMIRAGEENGQVLLTVEDDGPGIPEDRIGEVLRRGIRLDESKPGSGLGLSIVDDLTRACGGTLTLDRSPDLGGLRAALRLPAAARDGEPPR